MLHPPSLSVPGVAVWRGSVVVKVGFSETPREPVGLSSGTGVVGISVGFGVRVSVGLGREIGGRVGVAAGAMVGVGATV